MGLEFFSTDPPLPPPPSASNSPPSPPSNAILMGKAVDHCLSQLEWALYMRKAHVLISGITKNSLQPIDGRSENLPICPHLL